MTTPGTINGDYTKFRKALEHTINCHSMENGSNTPDFILARYLSDCLRAFDKATQLREAWHGQPSDSSDAPQSNEDFAEALHQNLVKISHTPIGEL
ncbi:MAG: hypothetical protein WC100_02445 [Sterolibacterium sp.]